MILTNSMKIPKRKIRSELRIGLIQHIILILVGRQGATTCTGIDEVVPKQRPQRDWTFVLYHVG